MSTPTTLRDLDMTSPLALFRALYARAPATVLTLSSLVLSYLVNVSILDYQLWRSLGPGGFAPSDVRGWLVHTFVLRPLAMDEAARRDSEYLPGVQGDSEDTGLRLGVRRGERPVVFGLMPHRQMEGGQKEGSELQQALADHLRQRSQSPELVHALSRLEAGTSPALYFDASSSARPSALSTLYLSGLRGPPDLKPTLPYLASPPFDHAETLHEFTHLHTHDGSLHIVLHPRDAREVVGKGWGELHGLAGAFWKGHWWPPYGLPRWLGGGGRGESRWAYVNRWLRGASEEERRKRKAVMIPPTYCIVYAPRDESELKAVKSIIDASISFATGRRI